MATEQVLSDDKCIFCKIAAGKEPKSNILHEADGFVIFRDHKPASKDHFLVIPKHHIKNPKQLGFNDIAFVERLISVGKDFLKSQGGDVSSSRIGFHWPPFTSINHLHLHVISPVSQMGWLASAVFKPGTFWFVSSDWFMKHLQSKK